MNTYGNCTLGIEIPREEVALNTITNLQNFYEKCSHFKYYNLNLTEFYWNSFKKKKKNGVILDLKKEERVRSNFNASTPVDVLRQLIASKNHGPIPKQFSPLKQSDLDGPWTSISAVISIINAYSPITPSPGCRGSSVTRTQHVDRNVMSKHKDWVRGVVRSRVFPHGLY